MGFLNRRQRPEPAAGAAPANGAPTAANGAPAAAPGAGPAVAEPEEMSPELAAAIAEELARPKPVPPRFDGSDEDLRAEIETLRAKISAGTGAEEQRRLLTLRHLEGIRVLEKARPSHPEPDDEKLPPYVDGPPPIPASEVTPGLLRAGILRDGCLLVRGLVPREQAEQLAEHIDQSFAQRENHDAGSPVEPGLYEEFVLHPPFDPFLGRPWIKMGGGVYAADSPTLSAEMIELLHESGMPALVDGYLGEQGLISVHKTTLRKADPSVPGTWHQDGKFMGPVRALNLWLSLSHCGDVAPGLDIVPQRLERYVETQTDEATLDTQVSHAKALQAAGERGIVRPIFEPGDAMLFDDLFLHQTGSDASMPNPRYALECWFFGASGFPLPYAPIAI